MRSHFFTALTLLLVGVACSAEGGPQTSRGGGGSTSGGGPSGSAGSASSSEHAQLRFVYQADWQEHLGTCAWISDYRIKFGANPVPVTATIDVASAEPTEYVEVDGRPYEDMDVLHVFTCSKSQTSKQTLQLYGKFGTDLQLSAGHEYTVTLAGSTATLSEDQ